MVIRQRHRNPNDIITIDAEEYEGPDEQTEYWCPYCHRNLTLVNRATGEYKCSVDPIPFYPREDKDIRSADIVDIPEDPEDKETLVSNTPDPLDGYYGRTKVEYQGGIRALSERGLHITSYQERSGSGRVTKTYNEGSNSRIGLGSGPGRRSLFAKPYREVGESD